MHPQRAKTHIAIVVDTSVARAAGESSAQSRACRDALLAVQDNQDCLLAISQALQQEWLARSDEPTRPHASRFAAQWLAKMESRGRVVDVTLPSETPLRRALEQVAHSGAPLAAHAQGLLKDLPVIETALYVEQSGDGACQGRRVFSLDRRVRRDAQVLKPHMPPEADFSAVCDIQWVNPTSDIQVKDWLLQGAPAKSEHRLC